MSNAHVEHTHKLQNVTINTWMSTQREYNAKLTDAKNRGNSSLNCNSSNRCAVKCSVEVREGHNSTQ